MTRRTIRIVAALSVMIGMVACDGDDDSATPVSEAAETTDDSGARATVPSSVDNESDTSSPALPRDFEVVDASTTWEPVLDGVTASPTPPPAVCDTTGSSAGDALELPEFMLETFGPEPPDASWFAAFDSDARRVTVIGQYGDGERVAAGSLDVCTDTWSPISSELLHPETDARGYVTALVYDVDSDAMVAYTTEGVFVHDVELDEWRHHPAPRDGSGSVEHLVLSAVYHPASGRVIVTDVAQLLAHDVDTDEWTPITTLPFDPGGGDLLGVDVAMDRFIFGVAGTGHDDESTWLVDPISGEAMVVQTPEHSHVNIGWPNEAFGPADGTVFVTHHMTGKLCGFDAEDLAWNRCVGSTDSSSDDDLAPGWDWAIIGDPVNDRLIGITSTTIESWPLPQP